MRPLTSATGLEPNDILRFILDDPYGQAKAGDEVTVREVRNGFIVLKESRVDGYHPSKFAWVRRPGSALQETDRRNEIFQLKMDGLRGQMDAIQAFRRVLTEHRIERASGQVEMLRPEDVEALMQKLAAVLTTTPARAEAQDEGTAGEIERLMTLAAEANDDGELDQAMRLVQQADALYAHPSPTPAADADRVRIAVEALDGAYHRWVINEGESVDVIERVGPLLAALKSEGK